MVLLAGYVVLAVANVAGHLAGADGLVTVTKPLLMPVLLAWLLTRRPRTRLLRLVAAALVLSWLGDLALMGNGDQWFLAGLGAFGLAQATYVLAFWPFAHRGSALRRRPVLAAPYLLTWVALVALLAPGLGGLVVPVAGYGLLLVTMAALATGVHPRTAMGAALFVVSDSLIALTGLAGYDVPQADALVMATYTAAQLLIVTGCVRRATTDSAATGTSSNPAPSVSTG